MVKQIVNKQNMIVTIFSSHLKKEGGEKKKGKRFMALKIFIKNFISQTEIKQHMRIPFLKKRVIYIKYDPLEKQEITCF